MNAKHAGLLGPLALPASQEPIVVATGTQAVDPKNSW
jgi:hypothetical protein